MKPPTEAALRVAIRAGLNKAGKSDSLGAYIPFTLAEIEHHVLTAVLAVLPKQSEMESETAAGQATPLFVLRSIKNELLKRGQDYGLVGDLIPVLEEKLERLPHPTDNNGAAFLKANPVVREALVIARNFLQDHLENVTYDVGPDLEKVKAALAAVNAHKP